MLFALGWDPARYRASSFADAAAHGATHLTDDALSMIAAPEIGIVIDATGSPAAGIRHALACCNEGKHIVMVNVEADALAGPLLAKKAAAAGIVYSLAYGDQPALIGRPVFRDLRWGVYVTFRAGDQSGEDYVRRCFGEYGFSTDPSGRYSAMYKPCHAIGLELGSSVASVGLRREATGAPDGWRGDVVATAKRALNAGETLDGAP